MRAELLLQIIRAAIVITMGMADDDIFDIGGIEVELAQAAFDVSQRTFISRRL